MEPTTVIAITFANGKLGRMQFYADPTNDAIQAEIDKGAWTSDIVSWRHASLADFPTNHQDFRNAWKDDGSSIVVDMSMARDITRNRLRRERAPLIEAKDVELSQALAREDRAAVMAIETERQRLRDITALLAIDAAVTPDDLKAISLATSLRRTT